MWWTPSGVLRAGVPLTCAHLEWCFDEHTFVSEVVWPRNADPRRHDAELQMLVSAWLHSQPLTRILLGNIITKHVSFFFSWQENVKVETGCAASGAERCSVMVMDRMAANLVGGQKWALMFRLSQICEIKLASEIESSVWIKPDGSSLILPWDLSSSAKDTHNFLYLLEDEFAAQKVADLFLFRFIQPHTTFSDDWAMRYYCENQTSKYQKGNKFVNAWNTGQNIATVGVLHAYTWTLVTFNHFCQTSSLGTNE